LSHWSDQDYAVDTTQILSGFEKGWYTLKGWARRSTGENESYLEVGCAGPGHGNGNKKDRVERVHVPVAWPDQWLQVVVSFNVKQNDECTISLHTTAKAGEWTNFDDIEVVAGRSTLSILGADVSSLSRSEDLGGRYSDGDKGDRSALEILADH